VRRLHDEVSLDGKLETITMMDLRMRPGEVLDSVMLGKSYILTRSGRPLALITRLPGEQLTIIIKPDGRVEYER